MGLSEFAAELGRGTKTAFSWTAWSVGSVGSAWQQIDVLMQLGRMRLGCDTHFLFPSDQ